MHNALCITNSRILPVRMSQLIMKEQDPLRAPAWRYRCIYMYGNALLPSCTCRAGIRRIEKRGKRGKRGKKRRKIKKTMKRKNNIPDRAQPKVLDHPDSSIIEISIGCASASGSLCWIELETGNGADHHPHHARKKGLSTREHPP